jgi:hypothetical protein
MYEPDRFVPVRSMITILMLPLMMRPVQLYIRHVGVTCHV